MTNQKGVKSYAYLLNESISYEVLLSGKKQSNNKLMSTLLTMLTGAGLGVAVYALKGKINKAKIGNFMNKVKFLIEKFNTFQKNKMIGVDKDFSKTIKKLLKVMVLNNLS